MMDPELKARWVAALRSGDYKQGKGCLHDLTNNTYCCLGVLCAIQGISTAEIVDLSAKTDGLGFLEAVYDEEDGEVVVQYGQYLGLNEDKRYTLATLNDGEKSQWNIGEPIAPKTFTELADIIEQDKEI